MTSRSHQETILIIQLNVPKQQKESFAIWLKKMNEVVSSFQGFISLEMRPQVFPDHVEWTSAQRFQTPEDLERWKQSEERKALFDEIKPLLLSEAGFKEIDPGTNKPDAHVTEVFVTKVSPGKQEAFRVWASKIQQLESQFPGYQGAFLQAPIKGEGENFVTILRFDNPSNLDRWLNSSERKEILKEGECFMDSLESHRVVSPFTGWFASVVEKTGEIPPVWKQTMLVLLVLFPIVMFELKFLNPQLKGLNSSPATFIGNAISVSLVSWPMMPIVIYFLSWWLSPGSQNALKKNILGTSLVLGLYLLEILLLWNFL